jgi:hypothetical protein
MTKLRNAIIAVVAGAMMLVAAQQALAARGDVRARTSDPNPGGEAYFFKKNGRHTLKVCDIQRDGVSVFAYVSYYKTRDNQVSDHGANGKCRSRRVRAAKGRRVYVKVCLVDQDQENVLGYCSTWKRGRA